MCRGSSLSLARRKTSLKGKYEAVTALLTKVPVQSFHFCKVYDLLNRQGIIYFTETKTWQNFRAL